MSSPILLQGIRILDCTSVIFGPFATQMLADLGAEVIKVEPPGGDMFRYSAKPAFTRAMSPGHLALNRGKQSAALDLKNEADLELVRRLIPGCDVFIHNMRAEAIERLGLGHDAVRALRPDGIYAHCVGFGSDGPYAGLQAYDDLIQAASGTTSLIGKVEGDGRPRYLPGAIADKVCGLYAAQAVLAALIHKLRTGQGQFVEIPMFETFTHFSMIEHLAGITFDPPNGPVCYARQIDPDRQPFPTRDGHIAIVPYSDEAWQAVFTILGDTAFLQDPALSTPLLRFRNISLLYQRIASLTPARTSADWVAQFRAAAIPAIAARAIEDILADPHLQAIGFFQRQEHPSEGAYFAMRAPLRFGAGQPTSEPRHAPLIGEHTAAVRALAADGRG